jgi:hypothetical protein
MSQTRAFYSVVQYVPNFGRAEAANTGVVLLVPSAGRVEVRTSRSLARVRQFFAPGKPQLRRIEVALESLKNRLTLARDEFKDESEFARFVAARADAVQLTAPRLVMIDEPLTDLNALYAELVGDEEDGRLTLPKVPTLPRRVAEVFGKLEAEGKAWRPGSITVPTIRRKFDVEFAYQNGVTNYVRLEALGQGAKLEARLAKLGFNGQLIFHHKIDDKPAKLVVMSSDPSVKPETEQEFQQALKDFHVRFVPYKQADEFAAEVERTAH